MAEQEQETIERQCLRCGKTFEGEGRFNRICPRCKHYEKYWGPPLAERHLTIHKRTNEYAGTETAWEMIDWEENR